MPTWHDHLTRRNQRQTMSRRPRANEIWQKRLVEGEPAAKKNLVFLTYGNGKLVPQEFGKPSVRDVTASVVLYLLATKGTCR